MYSIPLKNDPRTQDLKNALQILVRRKLQEKVTIKVADIRKVMR